MSVEELSMLRFGVINFFAVLMNRPVNSQALLCQIVHSIIEAETNPDEEYKDRVKYLYDNTSEKIRVPLTTVEDIVFRNINRGLSTEVDFERKGAGMTKTYTIAELMHILSNIRWELVTIVTKIIKKYTMEFPVADMTGFGIVGKEMGFNIGLPTKQT